MTEKVVCEGERSLVGTLVASDCRQGNAPITGSFAVKKLGHFLHEIDCLAMIGRSGQVQNAWA